MKHLAVLSGLVLVILVSGCTTQTGDQNTTNTIPLFGEQPLPLQIENISHDPALYKDEVVLVSGTLKRPKEFYLDDGKGHNVMIQGRDLSIYQVNSRYEVTGRLHVNEYCDCEVMKPVYVWTDYMVISATECTNMSGQCKAGSYTSGYKGETVCMCQTQEITRYYWAFEGKMFVTECEGDGRRCSEGSVIYDQPYIYVELMEAA